MTMQEMADKLTGANAILKRAISDIETARAMRNEVWDTMLVQEAVQSVDEDETHDIELNIAEAAAALEMARCEEHIAHSLIDEATYMLEARDAFQLEHERLVVDKELRNAGAYIL